jgi:hypothetical protein
VLDDTQEAVERREQLNDQLAEFHMPTTMGAGDRADRDARAATWGLLPGHQRGMRRAVEAGGSTARVGG